MSCGRDGTGMEASFLWMDSVNSTMDEVKRLIVKQKVLCSPRDGVRLSAA